MHNNNYHYENYHFDTTGKWTPTFNQLLSHSNDHPFNLSFNLPTQIHNIKKIYLKNVEMPIGFTNIRAENNSNTFTISINTIVCTIVINPGNYTIISLITAINNAIIASNIYTPELLPTFSILGQTIVITTPLTVMSSILFLSDTILSKVILGFPYNYQIPLTNSITSVSNFNIAYDTYLIIYLPYVNHKSSSAANQNISFKIPYNSSGNSIFYSVENTQFSQYIELTENNFILGNLKIVINDKYGFNINNNGLDWSFTLGVERDLTPKPIQEKHFYTLEEDEIY